MIALILLTIYLSYAAFLVRIGWHALIWWKGLRQSDLYAPSAPASLSRILALSAADILFFKRLFRVNAALWVGEWLFHLSLLFVALRHLTYFLDPPPGWLWRLQTAGVYAGHLLPLSLIYILVMRLFSEREKYTSPLNLFILTLLFLISVTGILMRYIFRPDVVAVKAFVIGILTFNSVPLPDSLLFVLHLFLLLILIPYLPSHIFAAFMVMVEAQTREEALKTVMHEK